MAMENVCKCTRNMNQHYGNLHVQAFLTSDFNSELRGSIQKHAIIQWHALQLIPGDFSHGQKTSMTMMTMTMMMMNRYLIIGANK